MKTPPPLAQRPHTPPTPNQGPMHDTYEPYSPRRSGRIHRKASPSPAMANPDLSRPSDRKQKPFRSSLNRNSIHTVSPPASPILSPRKSAKTARKSRPRDIEEEEDLPGEAGLSRLESGSGHPNHRESRLSQMLPTPAKTPRKRALHQDSNLNSAARVLFQNKQSEFEDIMPSSQKSRKSRKHAASTLESFADDLEKGQEVPIYTDSKERLPEVDESEENPFIVNDRRGSQPEVETRQSHARRTKTKHGMGKEIDEAIERGEGMVYVFRGRKIFRRFAEDEEDGSSRSVGAGRQHPASHQEALRRQIGVSARRPLTRSSVKPRLLFQSETRSRSSKEVEEEEALTDIETPPRGSQRSFSVSGDPQYNGAAAHLGGSQDIGGTGLDDSQTSSFEEAQPSTGSASAPRAKRGPKPSPFDSWRRTKPGVRSFSTKRQGEPLEKDEPAGGKRSRSAQA